MFKKLICLTGLLFALHSTTVLACSAMGANKHVGQVMTVDPKGGTFTIMDAQLQKPLTFSASKKVMDQIRQASGQIIVIFKQQKNKLIATGIEI